MANSDFLPGINTTLNDAGLRIGVPPAGPKLTLLGITSNTGIPLREAATVSNHEKAINSLYFSGEAGEKYPGELSLAIEEAVAAGAQHVEVMVIAHKSGSVLSGYINPTGSHTGRFFDLSGAYEVLKNRDVDAVVPVGAYIDDTSLGASDNFGKQLGDFCYQATTDQNSCFGVISVAPVNYWAIQQGTGVFSGTNVLAEVQRIATDPAAGDILNFRSWRFTAPSTDLHNLWVDYHSDILNSLSTPTVHAIYKNRMSGSYNTSHQRFADAATSTELDTAYFSSWQADNTDGTKAFDGRGNKVDAGMYISVPVMSIKTSSSQALDLARATDSSPTNTAYITDGAAAYAGLASSLAPHSATTNKFMGNAFPLKDMSRAKANRLVGMRNVTMYRRSKGFVVSKDVTSAHNVNKYTRSDYVLLTTLRITETAVDGIRAIAENYLGEANNAARINALDNEINGFLLGMKGSALNGFDFVISSTPEQRVLGELNIDLTLVPAFEITDIFLTVSLTKEL